MKLYNTTSSIKEEFKNIKGKEVLIYSCGPTVYGYPHIGNMRVYVHTDILIRLLEINGYNIKNVINITDVGHLTSDSDTGDDKLEIQAKKEGKKSYDIANYYTNKFVSYLELLNIKKPTYMPKATDFIKEQIDLIINLENKGFTYSTNDGIYFDTSKINNYAEIAKIDPNGLIAGYRVPIGEKKNSTDFALWKFSPSDKKRDMEWDSPWGIGFPGWHIECSAMALSLLGNTIDIHIGGIDHIHIHHASEIAQSETATGQKFANYWSHVNFLTTEEKMSKSLGNVITLDTLIDKGYSPMHLKYFYLLAHYKSELKFDNKEYNNLKAARSAYESLKRKSLELSTYTAKENKNLNEKFLEYLSDDLNTPEAISYIHTQLKNHLNKEELLSLLLLSDKVFGLNLFKEEHIDIPEEILSLAEQRLQHRKNKNWLEADNIRNLIYDKGFHIEDNTEGYSLSLVKKE